MEYTDRMVGTVSRGVRAPIIREGDNLSEIVVDCVLKAAENEHFDIRDKDVIAVTEAVVARAQGNYANIKDIAADVKEKFQDETVGILFPILSRNRFSICLKGIAMGCKKIVLMLSYPSDEVGNHLIDLDLMDEKGVNPWSDVLTESQYRELFGYEKGSFTGANIKGKIGLWEAAQNGTLFLDEVGELPLTFQAKLLRVIQEKEIVRVGGLTPIKVDVRIIAATNRNLARMVQAGEFREDLYYRLNVYPITVLPLRMRRADIIPLAKYFVERYNLEFGLQKSLGAKALEFLENQSFRGNIRELQNLIQRLMIMTNNRIIEARDVLQVLSMDSVEPPSVAAAVPSPDFHKQTTGGSLKEMLSQREREILQLYQQRYKSTRKIANMLGISQSSVVRKLNLYGLQSEDK